MVLPAWSGCGRADQTRKGIAWSSPLACGGYFIGGQGHYSLSILRRTGSSLRWTRRKGNLGKPEESTNLVAGLDVLVAHRELHAGGVDVDDLDALHTAGELCDVRGG